VDRAEWAHCHLADTELCGLFGKNRSQVQSLGSVDIPTGDFANDFRSNLIATPANTYTTMHYEILDVRCASGLELLDSRGEDPASDPAPSSMQQCYSFGCRVQQVHGNAICNQHSQQGARVRGQVAVKAVTDHEASLDALPPANLGPVMLTSNDKLTETRLKRILKRSPLPQNPTTRLRSPKA